MAEESKREDRVRTGSVTAVNIRKSKIRVLSAISVVSK